MVLAIKEQIVKTVVPSGNGGAVWVPKSWLGQEVVVTLPEKPKFELKERIIHLLEPYLKDIVSVGIYGSYARKEQTKDSDIDVLIITKDKDVKPNFKSENIDITSFPIEKFKKAIEKYPAMYYNMVQEAEPLFNAYVLEELKGIKIGKENFLIYLKETREHIKSSVELIDLDKLDYTYLKSYSVLYSSILRLKGLFTIRSILQKKVYSNKNFKKWLIGLGLTTKEFEESYEVYRLIRDDKSTKSLKIKIGIGEKVLNILGKELGSLEAQVHGK